MSSKGPRPDEHYPALQIWLAETETQTEDTVAAASSTDAGGRPSRREEILVAAARVIAERGFKGATVRDIGDAAGIRPGSLYYHFDSKDQIVLDLLLPSVQALFDEATSLCENAPNQTEALRSLIRSSVITTSQNPHKTVILQSSGPTFGEFEALAPITELRRNTLALWLDTIKQGIANGEFRDDIDPDVVVHGILQGVLGSVRWFTAPHDADPEAVTESLTRLYVTGITRS